MSAWKLIYRFSWSVLAVLVIIGLVCVFTPKCRALTGLRETRGTLELANADLVEEIKTLRIRQERFTTEPAYVERTAREIGMIRPGETVYIFTNSASLAATEREE